MLWCVRQAAENLVGVGGVGSEAAYRARFFSTLPDTLANSLKVNLGLPPSDAVIPDRAYNIKVRIR